jgi:hypothetical protein
MTAVTIPPVLQTLKSEFIKAQGYLTDRIFSVAPEETETLSVKDQLNRSAFYECNDVHVLSTLIKEWFRELPVPLLASLDTNVFMESEDVSKCIRAFESLPEPAQTLFAWLLQLLRMVVEHSAQNGMSAQSLGMCVSGYCECERYFAVWNIDTIGVCVCVCVEATVMAPNLYNAQLGVGYTFNGQDVDLIAFSLKIIHFVQQLISNPPDLVLASTF